MDPAKPHQEQPLDTPHPPARVPNPEDMTMEPHTSRVITHPFSHMHPLQDMPHRTITMSLELNMGSGYLIPVVLQGASPSSRQEQSQGQEPCNMLLQLPHTKHLRTVTLTIPVKHQCLLLREDTLHSCRRIHIMVVVRTITCLFFLISVLLSEVKRL